MEEEIITIPDGKDQVVCHGGHGALGHPAVYYSLIETHEVVCGYCDRRFVKASAAT